MPNGIEMATSKEKLCEWCSSIAPGLDGFKDSPLLSFGVSESSVELSGNVDVAALTERVLSEVRLLLEKLERGERLDGSPFAGFSVNKGPSWEDESDRTAVLELIRESVGEGLTKELDFALERIANIPSRLLNEAVLVVGLALEANGVWSIAGSGKEICRSFTRAIADREAETVADVCAASPGGWTPAIVEKGRLLHQTYKQILKDARNDYFSGSTCWKEVRRELLKKYPELAEVVDKIPVKEHFRASDLAFEVLSKRFSQASPSYLRKTIYGSNNSCEQQVCNCSLRLASVVSAAIEKIG